MKRFIRGQFVIYEGRPAYINFVSDQYLTVCTHETLKPPEEAEHAMSPIRQVNVCVCSDEWDQIFPDPQRPYNRFSTEYADIVENLK